jgi:hypothetical protein
LPAFGFSIVTALRIEVGGIIRPVIGKTKEFILFAVGQAISVYSCMCLGREGIVAIPTYIHGDGFRKILLAVECPVRAAGFIPIKISCCITAGQPSTATGYFFRLPDA